MINNRKNSAGEGRWASSYPYFSKGWRWRRVGINWTVCRVSYDNDKKQFMWVKNNFENDIDKV